jgi:uncharacterized protein YdcH (DUF465 family)
LKDSEVAEVLKQESGEFKKLEEEHKKLKLCLAEVNKKKFYTPDEEIERKNIQKQKLMMKDRMAEMIREYKKQKKTGK